MLPLILPWMLSVPLSSPDLTIVGTEENIHTGKLIAISLALGAQVETEAGTKTVKGPVTVFRPTTPRPTWPFGPQLITTTGDRIPGQVRGGDAKTVLFRPDALGESWALPLDLIAVVWMVTQPSDTPLDPKDYTWLGGFPTRDVLLFRNGDVVRGVFGAFTDEGVKFTPDGRTAQVIARNDLAAIGLNPRFARAPKPKGPYAKLVLMDGTRLTVLATAVKNNDLLAQALCGPELKIPLSRLVSLDVLQGAAVYLSDLKPDVKVTGFFGSEGKPGRWPWQVDPAGWLLTADRNVRGLPMRLLTQNGESTFDKGIGTHPKMVLTYQLDRKYARFEAVVGLDATTGKQGRADVRIYVDGQEADCAALRSLAAGPAVPVKLDVRQAKELVLQIDFGPTGNVQADVNWGDARLILAE